MKTLFTIILVSFTLIGFTQNSHKEIKKVNTRQSIEQIKKLKNGVLIIRLKTKSSTIKAFRDRGYEEEAQKAEENVKKTGLELIKAFRKNFNFCDFYFVASTYTIDLKEKNFKEVYFYDEKMEIDSLIKPDLSNFFIAEYGSVESDTNSYYQGSYVNRGEDGLEKRDTYSESGSFGYEALIIRDDQFMQLANPFPYNIRTWDGLIKPNKVVRKLNDELYEFYKTVQNENQQ